MTRSELIRKISKRAGVPDSETKVFFEIFLKRLSAILVTGQAVYLKGIGYLYFVQGNMKKFQDETEQVNLKPENIELLYFTEKPVTDIYSSNGLFFIVPVPDEDDFNAVDSAFSLSFGKPLIPFKGIVETEFFIPHTGSELRRLIESKVDKTIEYADLIEGTEFADTVIDVDQILLTRGKEHLSEDVSDFSFEDLLSDKDILKEIEEDAIIDLAETVDDKKSRDSKPMLSWDFDSFEELHDIDDKNEIQDKNETEQELTDEGKIKSASENKETDLDADKYDETIVLEPSEKFERVKTLTDVFDEVPDEKEENISPLLKGKEKIEIEDTLSEKIQSVKKEPEFIELNTAARLGLEQKEKSKQKIEKQIQQPVSEPSIESLTFSEKRNKFRQRQRSKSSNVLPFVMLALSIAIIVYGVYYYLTNIKDAGKKPDTELIVQFNTDGMKVVERDFDFPVSYPYPKRTGSTEDPENIFNLMQEEQVANLPDTSPETSVIEEQPIVISEETKPVVNNQPPPGIEKRIGVNLFQYGDVYVVQVAAFRSLSVAENEAGRFRNKGHNAFVERAEVDGSYWHRVKVGNFTDLEEAKKFAVQFK